MATATSYQEHAVDPTDTVTPPAGGSRYTTLATWWAAVKGSSTVAAWAKCYGGGNMAAVDIDGASYAGTSDYYTRIYAATDERHDGTLGSSGAYIDANSGALVTADENYIRVEGLRLVAQTGALYGLVSFDITDVENVLIDGIMVENNTGAGLWGMYLYGSSTGTRNVIARNCIFYGEGLATGIHAAFILRPATSGHVLNVTLQNCSINGWSTNGSGVLYYGTTTGATINATVQNVISTGSGTDFRETGSATINVTQTYCLSEDGTADNWGGAGNVTGEAAADVFETPASDLNLKTGSPAIDAGVNLYSTFMVDAVVNDRRPVAAWDMGALTTVTASYNLYRGVGGISGVDFSTAVGTAVAGASTKIFTGLGHVANTRYTYVLRPFRTLSDTSVLVTPDMSCRVEFETDGSGDWLGNRPGSVEGVSAEIISGGVIRVRWSYRTPYGGSAPNDFGIYYSTSPGITPGSPNATETYTADGAYSKDITLSDGVAYYFAITSRDATPVESHISEVIGPFIADDTAPDAPTLITATTF